MAFIIEEAQHRVIYDERSKNAESALSAHAKKGKGKSGNKKKHDKSSKTDSDENCENCRIRSPIAGPKEEAKRDKAQNRRRLKRKRKPNQLL